MRDDQIKLIRQKCIEANSTKEWNWHCPARKTCSVDFEEPVRLADVLLAIPQLWVQPKIERKDDYRYINNGVFSTGIKWNLRKDDLTEQSDETIAFLADLLK